MSGSATTADRDRTRERPVHVVTLVDGIGVSGGGERLAREIVVRLDPDRFRRTLCVSRWSADAARSPGAAEALAELHDAGVRFLGLERRAAFDIGAWRPLLRLLRDEQVDILHSHKFGSNVWGAVISALAGTPVFVAHEHTWSFEGQPVRRGLDRHLIARRVAAFIAVSREDRRRMIEVEGIPAAKVIVIPNGIPPPPPASGRDVRTELGIPPDAPVIGTVCALRPQKALDVLLRAVASLVAELPALRALIVGDGPERAALEGLVAELGLEGVVTLLGHRTDVPDILRALDVAVSSSDFEGSPLAVMEYMDAGLPVVATRVGGVPDLIESGVHGLLVDARDHPALAKDVAELLRDPARAREMGRRGRQRRRDSFDIEVTARRVAELYERLCASNQASAAAAIKSRSWLRRP